VDRLTRKELKTDKFAQEVGHTVEYVGEHRKQVMLYGGIALAVIVLGGATYFYRNYQHEQRESALREAILTQQATVGAAPNPTVRAYPTKAEKDKAAEKAFADVASRYDGSEEAAYALYMLGNLAMDQGRTADAVKRYQAVLDQGQANYASLAKMTLADIYASEGKLNQAEPLLRSVIDKPTALVSKEEATIELARLLAPTKPDEARKLLEPLRTSERQAVSRTAISELSSISAPRK
jgi:predicted negative regulator of RcsB-dependent stress response